jgi:RNA polymerase sigma-70 factor (ECF subfamily)
VTLVDSTSALRDALRVVYRDRGGELFAFAYRLTGSVGVAEDVVHESVLRVLDGRVRVDSGRGELGLLLFGVVRNVAREFRRKAGPAADVDAVDPAGAPERPEHVLAVQRALAALPEADREIVILSAYHGHSPREIAAILGRSSLVVRVRLHRARARLRQLLLAGAPRTADAPARMGVRS